MIWHSFFFALFAALACGFAVAVVLTSNVVRMAFYLVISLSATAGLFFLAGADFVGAMQLMIYVGGTLVLLIFGVMLTAQQEFLKMRTRLSEVLLASMVGLALLLLLSSAAFRIPAWRGPSAAATPATATPHTVGPLALGLIGIRVDATDDEARSGYLLAFELVSVHLLVVLIGAAYLARGRVPADSLAISPPSDTEEQADEPTSLLDEADTL